MGHRKRPALAAGVQAVQSLGKMTDSLLQSQTQSEQVILQSHCRATDPNELKIGVCKNMHTAGFRALTSQTLKQPRYLLLGKQVTWSMNTTDEHPGGEEKST